MSQEFVGMVLWFEGKRGYGFIGWEKAGVKQKDLFVHFSDIVCEGFKTLVKDQRVAFNVGVNKRGEPKATEVTVIK